MIRNLLATTALVTLVTGAAFAQENAAPAAPAQPAPMTDQAAPADGSSAQMKTQGQAAPAMQTAQGALASKLIGETVYNGTGDSAENIGNVNDLVIGADGRVEQVVVGVGGFLGLGEKNVALPYSEINWAERNGDRWIVVNATKDQLTSQPEFDRSAYEPAVASSAAGGNGAASSGTTGTMAEAPAATTTQAPAAEAAQNNAAGTAAATPGTDATQTAAIDRSTLKDMPAGELSAENLIGTTVYGANEENVGEIGDVVLTQDGKVDAVLIDVGGFLGIGEKQVAVGMDKLSFMTDGNGGNYLYTTFTKEQLDAATAYDKSSWAQNRDQQRLMMQ